MPGMHLLRPTPIRGLMAGLLALIAFASSAVVMTADGPSSGTTNLALAPAAQTVVHGGGARIEGARGDDEGDGRDDGGHH
jgi:hypothetical protein